METPQERYDAARTRFITHFPNATQEQAETICDLTENLLLARYPANKDNDLAHALWGAYQKCQVQPAPAAARPKKKQKTASKEKATSEGKLLVTLAKLNSEVNAVQVDELTMEEVQNKIKAALGLTKPTLKMYAYLGDANVTKIQNPQHLFSCFQKKSIIYCHETIQTGSDSSPTEFPDEESQTESSASTVSDREKARIFRQALVKRDKTLKCAATSATESVQACHIFPKHLETPSEQPSPAQTLGRQHLKRAGLTDFQDARNGILMIQELNRIMDRYWLYFADDGSLVFHPKLANPNLIQDHCIAAHVRMKQNLRITIPQDVLPVIQEHRLWIQNLWNRGWYVEIC
jgi:hypothetical protein